MWQCLIECFCTLGYYFSVDELLLFCVLADVSVAVFLISGDSLQYHASHIGSDNGGRLIPVCLDVSDLHASDPRGHYSRLVRMLDVSKLEKVIKERRNQERIEQQRMAAEEKRELSRLRRMKWQAFLPHNPLKRRFGIDPPESFSQISLQRMQRWKR